MSLPDRDSGIGPSLVRIVSAVGLCAVLGWFTLPRFFPELERASERQRPMPYAPAKTPDPGVPSHVTHVKSATEPPQPPAPEPRLVQEPAREPTAQPLEIPKEGPASMLAREPNGPNAPGSDDSPAPGQPPAQLPQARPALAATNGDDANEQRILAARPSVQIVMYSTSWCGVCRRARTYMQANRISFSDFDIENDPAAAMRAHELNPASSVPVITVDSSVMVGFSPNALESFITAAAKRRAGV